MENNETMITEEQGKRWTERFKELVLLLLERLKGKITPPTSKEWEEELLSEVESDEDKDILKDCFEEIDLYHAKMREMQQAMAEDKELTPGAWLEQRIVAIANEIAVKLSEEGRELNEEEKADLLKRVRETMKSDAECEIDALKEELSLIYGDAKEDGNTDNK